MSHWSDELDELCIYHNTVTWAKTQPSYKQAWKTCQHPDWMLKLASKLGVEQKLITLAACDCVETVLHFIPTEKYIPAEAIRIARLHCAGKATIQQARDAANAVATCNTIGVAAVFAAIAAANAYVDAVEAVNAATRAETWDEMLEVRSKKLATIVRLWIERPKLPSEI